MHSLIHSLRGHLSPLSFIAINQAAAAIQMRIWRTYTICLCFFTSFLQLVINPLFLWVGFRSLPSKPSAQKLYSQAPKGRYCVLMQKCIKRDIVETTGPRNLPLRSTWSIVFPDSPFLEEVVLMVTRAVEHMVEISRVHLACRLHSEHL